MIEDYHVNYWGRPLEGRRQASLIEVAHRRFRSTPAPFIW